ncbi:MAG: hypothetical protein ACOYCD_08200, partial [Kiritimatiellia bacterium]|jgi:hypothetical protein
VISNEVSGGDNIGGGGVCFNYAAKLLNSTVADNKSVGRGGGIQVYAPSGTLSVISNCLISGNQHLGTDTRRGVGIVVAGSPGHRVHIHNSVISNNSTYSLVGGISVENGSVVELIGSAITHNKGSMCGGLATWTCNSVLISNCTFTCNESLSYAGGIFHGYLSGNVGSMTVTHSRIIGNLATNYYGGGIYFKSNGVMEFCEIVSNSAMRSGGGVYIAPQTQTRIRNCLIMGNATTGSVSTYHRGGGIYIDVDGTNTLESCTLVGNQTMRSGDGLALMAAASNRILNCIVYSNSADYSDADLYLTGNDSTNAFHFSCSPTLPSGVQGNLPDYPMFVAPGEGYGLSLAGGDYRLAQGSPCINTGTNCSWMADAVDLDGHIRIDRFSGLADMGCYEHMPQGIIFHLR